MYWPCQLALRNLHRHRRHLYQGCQLAFFNVRFFEFGIFQECLAFSETTPRKTATKKISKLHEQNYFFSHSPTNADPLVGIQ